MHGQVMQGYMYIICHVCTINAGFTCTLFAMYVHVMQGYMYIICHVWTCNAGLTCTLFAMYGHVMQHTIAIVFPPPRVRSCMESV
jgi:hypothetical protein